jgi:hypothetical protein
MPQHVRPNEFTAGHFQPVADHIFLRTIGQRTPVGN